MNEVNLMVMITDDQQTRNDAKAGAYQADWKPLNNCADVENAIKIAWFSIDTYYHGRLVPMKIPKTLKILVGIRKGKTTYGHWVNGEKNIRTPRNENSKFKLETLCSQITEKIKNITGNTLSDSDKPPLMSVLVKETKTNELPLFASNNGLFNELSNAGFPSCAW